MTYRDSKLTILVIILIITGVLGVLYFFGKKEIILEKTHIIQKVPTDKIKKIE
jgi:hypothetical protein